MADMKEYLVEVDYCGRISFYVVSAKDAKDAIDTLYEREYKNRISYSVRKGYKPVLKKDFAARSLGSLHTELGRIIPIH